MLAAETVDAIIDYLHDDKAALATCTLVRRSWAPAARLHLFCDLIVDSENFPSLLSVLDTSPDIGFVVRSFTVQGGHDKQPLSPYRRRKYSALDAAFAAQAADLAAHMPNVRSLKLQMAAVAWELSIQEDILSGLSRTLTSITQLALTRVNFRTFGHATAFICAFPTLRRLTMTDVSWDTNAMVTPALARPLIVEISSMQIAIHARSLVDWLRVQDPLPAVHTASVQVGFDEGNYVTRRLLRSTLGPSIQILHLNLRKSTLNQLMYYTTFGLEGCTNLSALHFHGVSLWFLQRCPAIITYILSKVMSPHLREVTFYMHLSGVPSWANKRDELRGFDWKGVAEVLTGPQFGALQTIQVVLIFDGEVYPDWEQLVRARWSDFAKRGMLVLKQQHGFEN